jgi:hypothetical protein
MKTSYIAIISLVLVGTIGTSYALIVHNEAVNIEGNLQVIDGNLIVTKSGGGDSGLSVKNSGGSAVFQFTDVDDTQTYRFKLNKDGSNFQFIDATAGRTDLAVKLDTGNVGIGEVNPQEKLDVGGNLHVRDGNITSDGDICIGNCP